ncbi:MAG: Rid family detoxifying hydrolase [Candidatus Methanomethylophilus sp.]|nr:Rid family detoxifying hydrolase [Methanomethylophilus sp.]MDD3232906.1 Rid family detoxifying hydrolase [Methanomethylophilus sp.]MDD4221821.1 Rid family detoxifying hydrolase [Methanomethylophilus sp.]MDD4668495.1 Rid family detoxifying hydrolase [Methanomethylophilus sp.]
MTVIEVSTPQAPVAAGPYSQALVAGNLVFTAGEIPVDPVTGTVPESLEDQARQALKNLWAVLTAAGVKADGVVSVTVYLTDMNDFSQVNVIYADFFAKPYPARSCIAAAALPKGVRIMVSAIGVLN